MLKGSEHNYLHELSSAQFEAVLSPKGAQCTTDYIKFHRLIFENYSQLGELGIVHSNISLRDKIYRPLYKFLNKLP